MSQLPKTVYICEQFKIQPCPIFVQKDRQPKCSFIYTPISNRQIRPNQRAGNPYILITMKNNDARRLKNSFLISGAVIAFLWLVHTILLALSVDPGVFGVLPRKVEGLTGILTSPWVHGGWEHLLSNSAPLFVFIAASLYFYQKAFLRSLPWIFVMTGFWVWAAGHTGSHIGASGLVYGLAAFLFFTGVFRKDARSIALSLAIAFFYGGMVWGVLPVQEGVSWESHLFGAIAGTFTAWYYRKVGLPPRKKYRWEDEPENSPGDENAVWNYRKNWPGARVYYSPDNNRFPGEGQ